MCVCLCRCIGPVFMQAAGGTDCYERGSQRSISAVSGCSWVWHPHAFTRICSRVCACGTVLRGARSDQGRVVNECQKQICNSLSAVSLWRESEIFLNTFILNTHTHASAAGIASVCVCMCNLSKSLYSHFTVFADESKTVIWGLFTLTNVTSNRRGISHQMIDN